MPQKKHKFEEASVLAGRLFGRILSREADKGGYDYALDSLQTGKRSIQQLVVEMITSDEYIDRFVVPAGYEGAVKAVHALLLGDTLDDLEDAAQAVRKFALLGLKHYVDEIVSSEQYRKAVGANRIPSDI